MKLYTIQTVSHWCNLAFNYCSSISFRKKHKKEGRDFYFWVHYYREVMKRTAAILSFWAVHALTGVGTWWLPRSQVSCMEWDRSNSNEHKVRHHYTIGTWNLGMTSVLCSGMVRLNILQLGLYFTFISGITVMAVKAEG